MSAGPRGRYREEMRAAATPLISLVALAAGGGCGVEGGPVGAMADMRVGPSFERPDAAVDAEVLADAATGPAMDVVDLLDSARPRDVERPVDADEAPPASDTSHPGDAVHDAVPEPDMMADVAAATPDAPSDASPAPPSGPRPAVILMIGDGMGPDHLTAARYYTGAPLHMETGLRYRGRLITASLDGVTDSAAAATAMGSGVHTDNHFLGLDGERRPVEVAVELAHRLGARAGIVSTAALPNATPAGFSSHAPNRFDYTRIAASMMQVRPDVMLGGGSLYLQGYLPLLAADGFTFAHNAAGLRAPAAHGRLLGLFSPDHMTYVADRPEDTAEPTLAQMTARALEVLDPAPGGFFLMVEGAKIDLASHANNLLRAVTETAAFDEAVGVVLQWAANRPDTTVIVTADHETGELSVTEDRGPGQLPGATWSRGNHSNRLVDVFATGAAAEALDGQTLPNRWVHSVLSAALTNQPPEPPVFDLIPDGRLDDLAPAVRQTNATSFGVGFNQLDALWAASDAFGLHLGLEGLFERSRNAVVVLLDVDFGAATGLAGLEGQLADTSVRAHTALTNLRWQAPAIEGLGFDLALVTVGMADVQRDNNNGDAGLRGLSPPAALPWLEAPVNFADGVRPRGLPLEPVAAAGLETSIRWTDLFGDGGFPPGARVAVFVTLCSTDGTWLSNQTLPPLPAPGIAPERNPATIPGIVLLNLDTDLDGVPDPVPGIEIRTHGEP